MTDIDLKHELTLLLEKEVGFTGKFILEKQCKSLDIDPDNICCEDLVPLADRVIWAIKGYTGEKRADEIKKSILEYRKAINIVDNATAGKERPLDLLEAQLTIASKKMAVDMNDEAKEALDTARSMLYRMEKPEQARFEARISRMMGRLLSRDIASSDLARSEYEKAIANGRKAGQHYEVALSWNGLGGMAWRMGQHKEALSHYQKALTALEPFEAQSRNDKDRKHGAEALAKSGLGNVYLDLLDYENAIKYNEEAIKLFTEMENETEVGRVYNNLARVYEEMGNYPRAMDRYERAIRHTAESGSLKMQGWAMVNLASTQVEVGDLDGALENLEKAEKILKDFQDPIAHSKLNCMWGKYHRERGDWANAFTRFRKSIELVEGQRAPDYLAIALEEFGYMYLKKGDGTKAKELLDKALAWYKEKNETTHIVKIEKRLADL